MCQKIKDRNIPIVNKIWKSNILLAIIGNLLFFASILIFCDIKYEVSDDFVMSAIMSGAYSDAPNPHMIFINVLWGYLMLPFYYIFPKVSWYLVFQLALCLATWILVSYMLLEKLNRSAAIMLIIIVLTFFADDAYILVQFTKTAIIAVMGGGIVFAWALFKQRSVKLKVIAAVICFFGTLVRFYTIYIAGGFLLFILLVEFISLLRKNEEKKDLGKRLSSIALPGILLITLAFGCKNLDNFIYNQNSEYSFFRDYNKARAAVVDATDYGYEAYERELQELGVSENDYALMRTWNFADNNIFSLETMRKTADIISEYKKDMEISKEAILENMQSRGLWGYSICLACVTLTVLTVVFQRKYFWTVFVAFAIGFLYIIYFLLIERMVYRTEYAVFLGGFFCGLYFWADFTSGKGRDYIECNRICAIISMISIALQAPLYIPDRSYQDVTSSERRNYIDNIFYESWDYDARKYRKVVNKGNKSENLLHEIETHKENLYFLDFQTTIQTLYFEWNPWKSLPVNYFSNALYLASVMTNFPDEREILSSYNVENPLKSLVDDNVYLIDTDWRTLNQKVTFLQEHYYPEARAELYKELDGYQIWKIYKR